MRLLRKRNEVTMSQLTLEDIKSTSSEALEGIRDTLGARQKLVLECIRNHPEGISRTEITEELGLPINRTTPRVHELLRKNLIVESHKRKDKWTGKNVWALVAR